MKYLSKLRKRNNMTFMLAIIVITIFWMFIYVNVPIGHDDWTWGSYIGVDRLESFLKDYNGRYLGSLVTVILTRTYVIRAIIMSCITVGISILMVKVVTVHKKKYTMLLLIITILLLLAPRNIFRQTFSWIAGFSNYVPPILLVLIYIVYIREIFSKSRVERNGKVYLILGLVLSIATQLFVEHMTLYLIMLGIFTLGYSYIKFKRVYKIDVCVLIGSILGAAIMFSNGAYHKISEQEDSYRTMATSITEMIKTAINQYVNIINKEFFMVMIILVILLAVLGCTLVVCKIKKSRNQVKIGEIISLIIIITYPLYLLFINHYTEIVFVNDMVNDIVQAIFSLMFYLALAGIITIALEEREKKERTLFLLGSALIILAPLTVVTPIGGRNFLASYIFLVLLTVELIEYFIADIDIKSVQVIGIIGCLTVMCPLSMVFYSIGQDGRYRDQRIKDQIEQGKNIIYVPRIEHAEYLQVANPRFNNGYGAEYGFRAYYNLSKETKVVLGDLKDETDVVSYLGKVKDKSYMVIISVKDEASKGITEEICNAMAELGLQESLKGQLRVSYLAIIDEEQIVYETLSNASVKESLEIDDMSIRAISSGFEVGNTASIIINDIEYAVNSRGLNIVVYDKNAKKVIDSVCFDTHDTGKAYR